MPGARVLVVADDPLVRSGLSLLLSGQAGLTVVGQAAADEDLAQAAGAYQPDVVLWDMGSTGAPRVERLIEVAEALPPVLALVSEPELASPVWSAGVRGVLLRDGPAERIGAALAAVAEGVVVLEAEVAAALVRRGQAAPPDMVDSLTPRELDVLRLLAEGLPNKAIADRLGVSENTVKFHVNAIFGKLGVQSRTEAVTRATRLGLIPL